MTFSRLFQSCKECFLSEVDLLKENAANPKVKGQLISHESKMIFDVAWAMLQVKRRYAK